MLFNYSFAIVFIISVVFNYTLLSQNIPVSATSFKDNGELHQLLKKYFPNIPESFFLFSITTAETPHILSVHVGRDYQDIKENFACPHIYYVLNKKGGVSQKTLEKYFTETIKMPFTDDIKKNLILNDSLFEALSRGKYELAKTFYVYQGRLLHEYYSKNEPVSFRHYPYPYDVAKVRLEKKVLLKNDTFPINTNNIITPLFNNILQYADADNSLRIVNPHSGEIIKILEMEKLDALSFFEKYIAKNKADIKDAKQFEGYLKKINRRQLPLYRMSVDDSVIYVGGGLQVYMTSKEDYKYYDDAGELQVTKKGTPNGELFGLLYELDTILNIKKVYHILPYESCPKQFQKLYEGGICSAMLVKKKFIYSPHSYINFDYGFKKKPSLTKSKYYNKGISRYIIKKEKVVFDDVMPVPLARNLDAYDYTLSIPKFTRWKQEDLFFYDVAPEIYSLDSSQAAGKLFGTGNPEKPEKFKHHPEDTINEYFNWYILASGSVFEDKFQAFLYTYQGVPLLELKDKEWKTVQVIDLTALEGMDYISRYEFHPGNAAFLKDNIFCVIIYDNKEEEFFLYHYKIESGG